MQWEPKVLRGIAFVHSLLCFPSETRPASDKLKNASAWDLNLTLAYQKSKKVLEHIKATQNNAKISDLRLTSDRLKFWRF